MLADLVAADRGRRRMKRTPLSSVNCGKRNCIALAPECSASQLCDGYRPVLLETFIEKQRFQGTCYRAANWLCVVETRGRGKLDTAHACAVPVKSVWVRPLTPRFRELLAG
jgi:hypothetical protein